MNSLPHLSSEAVARPGVGDGTGHGSPPLTDGRRARELQVWLASQAEVEVASVTLPKSGRRYEIHIPTEATRERLFDEARKDPIKQMPYWARIWASGVALADAVLARPEQLAGQRVLEMGCGLGVTATAAIQVGARLTVADYTTMPLAFCRYNTLRNAGDGPRSLRVNWRTPDPLSWTRATAGGGWPIILAADVLYESRDIMPLLELVDRLLAPDGVLWLAEPGRRTAQRFLNVAASLGWEGESEYHTGPWPDQRDTRVGIHFLRRPATIDPLAASLGGWRT
ncbi:MAG TPA: methyltransferase type 12 [Thermomicrobiales bacterium]|nr:methyltransferase type 12 [Thermomicrobiales bacterium]